jgi:hypothetical protein
MLVFAASSPNSTLSFATNSVVVAVHLVAVENRLNAHYSMTVAILLQVLLIKQKQLYWTILTIMILSCL